MSHGLHALDDLELTQIKGFARPAKGMKPL
jgi:hypothetical protein